MTGAGSCATVTAAGGAGSGTTRGAGSLNKRIAAAIDPTFELTPANARAVAEVCVRLDGLPLALELAAATVDVLSPHGILARLDRPLELLSAEAGDMPARHLTMRRAVGWSYDLLAPREKISQL